MLVNLRPAPAPALAAPPALVEVFKTNVNSAGLAAAVTHALHQHFELARVGFDLQDCDRVLRVQVAVAAGPELWEPLMQLVDDLGVEIELLPD